MSTETERPYSSWSTGEIERQLWFFESDEAELELAIQELSDRNDPKAKSVITKLLKLKQNKNANLKDNIEYLNPETRVFMQNTLAKLREKLIDISRRNPLISFKHSERGATFVRVIDKLPNSLFKSLQSGGMSFSPLPNPDQEPADQKTPGFKIALERARLTDETYLAALSKLGADVEDEEVVQKLERELVARVREALGLPKLAEGKKLDIEAFARANGFDPNFDLPSPGAPGAHLSDNTIRVLYTRDRLEARLRSIYDRYRSFAADLGIHTLQVVFGFVQWREADGEKVPHHSPLLMMPVNLRREVKAGKYVYTLSGDDENLVVNMALQEMLRRNFGIVLPPVNEDDTPEDYFVKAQNVFDAAQSKLVIRRFVTLTVLPFPNMAVWQDLDPSVWPNERLLGDPRLQRLFGATGGATGMGAFPKDYEVEQLPESEVPSLVLPADVSQHSALIDVAARRSLAVEGPPGTGKSQTIANMIAGALDQGRRVLFVAEKRAALEVVARRLEALGFGPLMLELHSERSTKAKVIESLAARLRWTAPKDDGKLDQTRRDIAERRRLLKLYRSMLRHQIGLLQRPVNALIWREMWLRRGLENTVDHGIWSRHVPEADNVDELDLLRKREALTAVENTALAIIEAFGSLAKSRWRAARNAPAEPIGQDRARADLQLAIIAVESVRDSLAEFQRLLRKSDPSEIGDLDYWSTTTANLPDPSGYDDLRLRACFSEQAKVQRAVEELLIWKKYLGDLCDAHPSPETADIQKIRATEEAFARVKLYGSNRNDVLDKIILSEKRLDAARQLSALVLEYREKLGERFTGVISQIRGLGSALNELAEIADDILFLRSRALLDETAHRRLSEAREAAGKLRDQEQALGRFCDLSRLANVTPEELDEAAKALESTSLLLRPFSGTYRRAIAQASTLGANKNARPASLSTGLAAAASHLRGAELFQTNARYSGLFPDTVWVGHRSDFDGALKLEVAISNISQRLENLGLGWAMEQIISLPIRYIRSLTEITRSSWHALELLEANSAQNATVADIEVELAQEVKGLAQAIQTFDDAKLTPATEVGPGEKLSIAFKTLQQARKSIDQISIDLPWFLGTSEPVAELEAHLNLGRKILGSGLRDELLHSLTNSEEPARLIHDLRTASLGGGASMKHLQESWGRFAEFYGVEEQRFFGASLLALTPAQVAEALREAIDDAKGLRLYADLGRYLLDASDKSVRWIADAVLNSGKTPTRLADAYELALIRTLLQQLFKADNSMFERLGGAQLSQASRRFVELDIQLSKLDAARIIADRQKDESKAPSGVSSGPRSRWTEMALIENEVGKVKRHIPIRDLVSRAHSALQFIKPVWLMSPTSVAQFLPPGSADFDLVLIDEASQMTPEMAVGALGRGQQIVVVGDPKQLPPTNFFRNRSETVEDDEDDGFEVENESILDLAFSRLNHRRRLKWHYRSQHADLIRFSNRQFYENELVIFPSPVTSDDFLGVKSRFVGGIYEGRINTKEAEEVIEALVGLIYARPELTFGVVTMNTHQRELIMQEFDRIRAENKIVAEYVQARENTVDELFIKNLENVQGEERDIILISTLYGPQTPGGRVLQRFGLFNRKDGHRRLNVLITRARMATLVFTSLQPTDVVVTETSSHGVRSFREYLAYAQGAAFADDETGGVPDSDFEKYVAESLRANGYQVVPQVGVEGFRIDLGVKHPSYPAGFLAGIECDGATYHSGLSVRDRDRIRQDVLERLGWRIYRVWSTDWFNDPAKETTKLVAELDRLREKAEASSASRRGRDAETRHPEVKIKKALPPAPPVSKVSQETPQATPRSTRLAPEPMSLQPREDTKSQPNRELKQQATPPRGPSGKRHVVDGIEFYEDMPGYFEVWIDGEARGSVERLTTAMSAARVYGGAFQAPKPQFEGVQFWDDVIFVSDDIYKAVRRIASNYGGVTGLKPS